jgi:hypothetical protein
MIGLSMGGFFFFQARGFKQGYDLGATRGVMFVIALLSPQEREKVKGLLEKRINEKRNRG